MSSASQTHRPASRFAALDPATAAELVSDTTKEYTVCRRAAERGDAVKRGTSLKRRQYGATYAASSRHDDVEQIMKMISFFQACDQRHPELSTTTPMEGFNLVWMWV